VLLEWRPVAKRVPASMSARRLDPRPAWAPEHWLVAARPSCMTVDPVADSLRQPVVPRCRSGRRYFLPTEAELPRALRRPGPGDMHACGRSRLDHHVIAGNKVRTKPHGYCCRCPSQFTNHHWHPVSSLPFPPLSLGCQIWPQRSPTARMYGC